jgi:SAM-dependent methyltransferase
MTFMGGCLLSSWRQQTSTDAPPTADIRARNVAGNVAAVDSRTPVAETQQTYDYIAPEYARRNAVDPTRAVEVIATFAAGLRPGAVVADVGCGPGREAALIRRHGLRVAGFDLSMGQLGAGDNPDVAQADMRHLPLRTGSVDAIWCHAALLHIPRPEVPMVLAEFARVARPGGRLYLYVADGDGEGFEAAARYGSARRRWFTFHRERELVPLLASAGFTVDQVSRSQNSRNWLELHAHRAPDCRPPALPAKLRQATQADLPAIQAIISAAYDKYLTRMDRPPAPVVRDYGPAIEAGEIWVAGSPIVGLISLIEADDVLLIENVAVHPDRQGTGLGRRLMEFAEHQAERRQIRRLALYTNEVMTENLALYAHLGYHVTGRATEDGYRRVFLEKALPVSEHGTPD